MVSPYHPILIAHQPPIAPDLASLLPNHALLSAQLAAFAATVIASSASAPTSTPTPTLLVGLRRAPAASRELDRLFWAVADPAQPGAVQVDGPADLASVVAADASTVAAATAWLRSIGADMASLRLHPTGDSIEVAWPAGAGKDKAPRADGAFSDFVILKGARAAPASHRNPVRSRRTGSKGSVLNMTRGMHTEDSSLGPGPQSKAYGVPAGLKGTNKGNSQMVS